MRGLLLCCFVALATCQSLRYDLSLDPKKSYEYRYEGMVNFGLGKQNLAESGVKITCKVKITGASEQTYVLQVSDLAFAEYNGFPGKNGYDASPELTRLIAAQLVKPFMFEYANGHVGDIRASPEVSTTIVNIVRGILEFFQVTVKTTQRFYDLEEIGIHGKCQSHYTIEENLEAKNVTISQVVDVTNCREKAEMYKGMATSVVDNISKQRGKSVYSTVRNVYTITPSTEGGLLTKAETRERQHFTPFNVKGGAFKMQAMKELVLLGVYDTASTPTFGPMESKGNIIFKFANIHSNFPILMQNLEEPIPKITKLIKRLAAANSYQVDSATTEDCIKLYQLMKVVPFEGLNSLWKEFEGDHEQRRWFLDVTVEIGDARAFNFLKSRFQAGDLTPTEAWQTFLMAVEHLEATAELVEITKEFLRIPYSKSDTNLWHTVVLSYGSVVYKHCAYHTPCPVSAVQPLLDMATEALKSGKKEDMILILKALGNAGHPGSIKTIMRFLPGVAATPKDLPPAVQSAAVQAMRLIAARDPHSVQDITMSLFLQKDLPSEIRMLAFVILFDAKPSMAAVSTVTEHLLDEKDLHVASLAYSYLEGFARSTTPDNHFLSTAANIAVKILAPKFGRLSYYYSKAKHMDWFDDNFLIGTATEMYMIRNAAYMFPSEVMMKGKLHVIGRIVELLELGMRLEGIKELFGAGIPGFKGDYSFSDFQAIFKVLENWESLPNDDPLFTAYSRASGQEWFYADISKDLIRSIVMALNPSAWRGSPLWTAMESLKSGASWHYTRAFLILDARYFQPSTLGLPVEISKYYNSVTVITANAKAVAKPPPTQHLHQLLSSEIELETDGFAGVTKNYWVFYGVNTELFQSGSEFRNKVPIGLPWKFTIKFNIPERKFELEFPPCTKEIPLISLRADVYAISRNIAEPDMPKETPIMPHPTESSVESQKPMNTNYWHPSYNMCAESKIYGVGVCMDYDLRRQYHHEEFPLYYFLGFSHMELKIVPVNSTKTVEKIYFEVNAGTFKHPINAQQLLQTLAQLSKKATQQVSLGSDSSSAERESHSHQFEGRDSTPEALCNFKALAMDENQKYEGYDAAMYYTPEANAHSAQLIVSQVGANTNWKMCVDTSVDARPEAKTHLRWGAECQSYEMSMKAGAFNLSSPKPTLKSKVQFTRIPEYMAEMGKRAERYIPGMALLLGFYQEDESYAKDEVSASVTVASEDSIDVNVTFPEYTVYRKAVPLSVGFQNMTTAQ
ncbi:vitellogenin 3, phosvitinless [Oryzias melastigma]|uniref:vitellogenin 3, phosvitinless n=1 Tax=Oryzias melastigma TaxID=30732 RepID=UPI000CF82965|nr:vitellogenin 3, phosvitinless [Oryzias melastigma]